MKKKKVKKTVRHVDSHPIFKIPKSFGQKAADGITKWAGSWAFILTFLLIVAVWVFINGYYLLQYKQGAPFDPFPFILLNLGLSLLAALQAPVILMSQNRTSQKDRLRAEYDYQINKRSEKEIQGLKKQLNRIEKKL